MNLQQAQRSIMVAFIMGWLFLALWELLMFARTQWHLSPLEKGVWYMFFLLVPILAMLGMRLQRLWAGWMVMVYGVLLVVLDLNLAVAVVQKPELPDVGLLVLVPMAVIGGHLVTNATGLYQLMQAAKLHQVGEIHDHDKLDG